MISHQCTLLRLDQPAVHSTNSPPRMTHKRWCHAPYDLGCFVMQSAVSSSSSRATSGESGAGGKWQPTALPAAALGVYASPPEQRRKAAIVCALVLCSGLVF